MVFLSSTYPRRTLGQRILRIMIGLSVITAIVFVLYQVPYDVLREERARLYGETATTGVVVDMHVDDEARYGSRHVIEYKYVDPDGYARQAMAPLPEQVWKRFNKGSRLKVIYATSRPDLSRIPGEIEPPFQLWLRKALN